MKAQDVMVRDVLTVGPDTSVAEAVAMLVKHDISALPVVDPDGYLIGILSEADLLEREEFGSTRTGNGVALPRATVGCK
jgi:CBS domain-containing protein